MSKRAWLIFAAICVILLGGLIFVSNKDKTNVDTVNLNTIQKADAKSGDIADHVFGKADSKVILIEYGDFQCPGCGSAHPNIKRATEKYRDQMAFVFRNFPLSSIHPNARAASAAAEASGLQGKYWEMHNLLYENQSAWESLSPDKRIDFFTSYAQDLGLNTSTFKTDFASDKVNQKINFDVAIGKKANVSATPSFFLNGKPIDQATWQDEQKLDSAFADALKLAGIALPTETN